jgi:catechol 2,3-dioxygenase-like lactoylglutathione lyase family enzyme
METATTSSPTTTLVSGFNHVAVITGDLDRLAAFYAEVFDAEVLDAPAPPGTRVAFVRISATAAIDVIEVRDSPHAAGSTQMLDRGHLDHLALEAPTPGALAELRRRLVARGASDGAVSDYGPILTVKFVDPDGMASEVAWVRDPTFDGAHPPQPFTGSLDDLV